MEVFGIVSVEKGLSVRSVKSGSAKRLAVKSTSFLIFLIYSFLFSSLIDLEERKLY